MWWKNNKNVRFKENKIVVKIRDYFDGSLQDSISIPSDYYPLFSNDMKVFTCDNTSEFTDNSILEKIDNVKYEIGRCYGNSEKIYDLIKDDCNVEAYEGWLFVDISQYPVHHSWLVIDDIYVIDLSDEYTCWDKYCESNNIDRNTYDTASLIIELRKHIKGMKNSVKCYPMGKCHPMLLYVGSKCEPAKARNHYQNLMAKYPNHKVQRNCDSSGMNSTQKLLQENGLL